MPLTLVAFLLLWPAAAHAQAGVGASFGLATSDYTELDRPLVAGASLELQVGSWAWLRPWVDYRYRQQRSTRELSTCQGLVPPGTVCESEKFRESFSLRSVATGILTEVPVEAGFTAVAGLARSWFWVRGGWQSLESEHRRGLLAPDESVRGWTGILEARYALRPSVRLRAGVRTDAPDFNYCVLDAYAPFCEAHRFWGFELGAHWSWSAPETP